MNESRGLLPHRAGRDGRRIRLLAALMGSAAAVSAGTAGCGEATQPGGDAPVAVGEAPQGLTAAPVCLTIRRQGASGSVYDTQIVASNATNYGQSGTFNAGTLKGAERQTLLQFDLSAIPSGARITTAVLNLADGVQPPSGPGTVEVHRILAPWSESTVTWQSFAGAYDPDVVTTFDNAALYPSATVVPLVQGWVQGSFPNHGLLLAQPGPDVTNFWSSEYFSVFSRPSLDVCYTVPCAAGTADCNGSGLDGCETDTTSSAQSCGACGVACAVPNATAACIAGACHVGACNPGFGDCDGDADNGCETALDTAASCGACSVACTLPHATASCATGTCTLTACDPGHSDCDGNPANGCEPAPCADGSHCGANADCGSGFCQGGFCAAPACTDSVKNGAETGIDCGGPTCPPCGVGQACASASDCASGLCTGGVCTAASCSDGVKNGTETAVDCGGSCSAKCATGAGCLAGADCASGVCTTGTCQAAVCNDGVKNGGETGVDCGGACSAKCAAGQGCATGADCQGGVCAGGVCKGPTCSDGIQNGSEAGIDCGSTCSNVCWISDKPPTYSHTSGCFWSFVAGTLDGHAALAMSGASGPTLVADFGVPTFIDAFAANAWSSAYGQGGMKNFVIEYSTNNTTWTPAFSGTHPSSSATAYYAFPGATARYWRMRITSTYMTFGTSCGANQFQGVFQFRAQ